MEKKTICSDKYSTMAEGGGGNLSNFYKNISCKQALKLQLQRLSYKNCCENLTAHYKIEYRINNVQQQKGDIISWTGYLVGSGEGVQHTLPRLETLPMSGIGVGPGGSFDLFVRLAMKKPTKMVLIAAVPVRACILHDASVGKTVLNTCQVKTRNTNVIQRVNFYCICCHFLFCFGYTIGCQLLIKDIEVQKQSN